MGRVGVTYYEVETVCEELLVQHHALTVDNVRRKLGDTGSRSTIAKHLKDWKERQAQKKSPESLTDSLASVLKDQSGLIYTAIRDDIEKQFQHERETLQQTINALDVKNSELRDQIEQLTQSLEKRQHEQATNEKQIHLLNATVNDLLEDVKQREQSHAFQAGQLETLKTIIHDKNEIETALKQRIEALLSENAHLLSDKDYLLLHKKYDGEKLVTLKYINSELTGDGQRLREKLAMTEAKLALTQQLRQHQSASPHAESRRPRKRVR